MLFEIIQYRRSYLFKIKGKYNTKKAKKIRSSRILTVMKKHSQNRDNANQQT
jgi:hypothetical protein